MIDPGSIPQFTGDLGAIEAAGAALSKLGGTIETRGAHVHSTFQGLAGSYHAPEAQELFDSTKPVQTQAAAFGGNVTSVGGALSQFAHEARPIVQRLQTLKADATSFVNSIKGDDDWTDDGDKVDHNNQLLHDVNAAYVQFLAVEAAAANKIQNLYGGKLFHGGTPSKDDPYAYMTSIPDDVKTPWGTKEKESHWYDKAIHWVDHHLPGWAQPVWDAWAGFEKGFWIDGVWGTVKGLGLLAFDGMMWQTGTHDLMHSVAPGLVDQADGAAKNVAYLAADAAIWATPGLGASLTTASKTGALPGPVKDFVDKSNQAGVGFLKGLVAWDEWGKDPARASGAVTFNVVSFLVPGPKGAGAMLKGTAEAGELGVRGLGEAGELGGRGAGEAADLGAHAPTAAELADNVFGGKDVDAALSGAGDLERGAAGLDDLGKVDVPNIGESDLPAIGDHPVTTDPVPVADHPAGTDPVQSAGAHDPAPAGGAHDPVPAGGAHDPVPSAGAHDPVPAGGAHDPVPPAGAHDPVPAGGTHDPAPPGGEHAPADPATPPSEHQPVPPDGSGPHDAQIPHDGAPPHPGHDLPQPPLSEHHPLAPIDESRVVRNPHDGLIEKIDGKPVDRAVEDIGKERAAEYRDLRQEGVPGFSRNKVGPVTSTVFDRLTGRFYEGSNNLFPKGEIPGNLHPTLQERLDRLSEAAQANPERFDHGNGLRSGYPHPDIPGTHAEVYAANKALWERHMAGLPDGPEALKDLIADNRFPYASEGVKPAPMCGNCTQILGPVESIPGKLDHFIPRGAVHDPVGAGAPDGAAGNALDHAEPPRDVAPRDETVQPGQDPASADAGQGPPAVPGAHGESGSAHVAAPDSTTSSTASAAGAGGAHIEPVAHDHPVASDGGAGDLPGGGEGSPGGSGGGGGAGDLSLPDPTGGAPHWEQPPNVDGDYRLGPEYINTDRVEALAKDWDQVRYGSLSKEEFLAKWTDPETHGWRWDLVPDGGYAPIEVDGHVVPDKGEVVLEPGTKIDRFGEEGGQFLSPDGTPYEHRALPPSNLVPRPGLPAAVNDAHPFNYYRYEVVRPFKVDAGTIAPAFEQPGGGIQFVLDSRHFTDVGEVPPRLDVDWLVENGYLRRLPAW